jgi:uncharacterized UPF0160 family protein
VSTAPFWSGSPDLSEPALRHWKSVLGNRELVNAVWLSVKTPVIAIAVLIPLGFAMAVALLQSTRILRPGRSGFETSRLLQAGLHCAHVQRSQVFGIGIRRGLQGGAGVHRKSWLYYRPAGQTANRISADATTARTMRCLSTQPARPAMTTPVSASTKPVRIATHNGSFHADDVFGVAVLLLLHPQAELVRTRDPATIAEADFAVDVGGEWDQARGRFDHHQRGFSGARPNGVVYASAGLVWEAFGARLVAQMTGPGRADAVLAQAVANELDVELVQHLDRADTGASHGAPGLFGLSALLSQFNTTWDNPAAAGKDGRAALAGFRKALEVTTLFIQASVDQLRAKHDGAQLVRQADKVHGGAVLVLPRGSLPWADVVCAEMPEALFVVYPDSSDTQFQVHVVTVEPNSFVARKDLPRAWAGLRGAELAAVCGVQDAVFCHNGRFIAGAGSLQGALRMAELALLSDAAT